MFYTYILYYWLGGIPCLKATCLMGEIRRIAVAPAVHLVPVDPAVTVAVRAVEAPLVAPTPAPLLQVDAAVAVGVRAGEVFRPVTIDLAVAVTIHAVEAGVMIRVAPVGRREQLHTCGNGPCRHGIRSRGL